MSHYTLFPKVEKTKRKEVLKMKNSYLAFIALLGLAFIIMTPGVSLAEFDLFIRVAGVDGESTDDRHPDWIDGISYSSGIVSDGGRACFNDISIVKNYDKSSPTLSLYAAMGTHIDEVRIEFCRAVGDKQRFLEVLLRDATITSISSGGSAMGGEGLPVEQVAFSFSSIRWTYTLFKPDGSPGGNVEETVDPVTLCNATAH